MDRPMDRPIVVVVPCYREPLDRVRRSVESALAIPLPDVRVVIVDDGAGDEQLDVLHDEMACLSELAVTVLHRDRNGGPSAALNTGIASAPDGSVICRLDVGDVFYPEPKARQIETVLRGDARASCSGHYDPVADRVHQVPADWRRRIYGDSCFSGVTTVYLREVWEAVGRCDESYRWAEDWRFSLLIEHVVGFSLFEEVTCSAGMFPGGHSDTTGDPAKLEARNRDRRRAREFGQQLGDPARYAHLYSEKFCRKYGLTPLPRRSRQ